MREVIGRTPIQPALTELRAQIETDVLRQTQQILDNYKAGRRDHPGAAAEGRSAGRGGRKLPSTCSAPTPTPNGCATRPRPTATTSCRAPVAMPRASWRRGRAPGRPRSPQATGQTQRFLSVLAAYQAAKDVTLRRMYLETMQDILTHSPSLVVDDKLKGLVPFLPLNLPNPHAGAHRLRRAPHRPPPPGGIAGEGAPR